MNKHIKNWKALGFGMFIHFGIYSAFGGVYRGIPITEGYSEQIMQFAPVPKEEYLKMARNMTLSAFSPEAIVTLAKQSEMKYIVLTAKHHDGFCMFDTDTTDFQVVKQTYFGKDVVRLVSEECTRQGIKFGLYFSLVDWNLGHPFDPENRNPISPEIEEILCLQLEELMKNYGEICELWFDMASPTESQSIRFREIVKRSQPQTMINGRIGNGKGDFITFWDNEIPETAPDSAWQTPQSIYPDTWGYRSWRTHESAETRARLLIQNFESVRSRGGNYLLNIGLKGDGSVDEFEQSVLLHIGKYIRENKKRK